MRSGAELLTFEVEPSAHPLARFAGTLPDDELTKEWIQAMAEYRRDVDKEANEA